jgi:WNK lysine deficient protein kinase
VVQVLHGGETMESSDFRETTTTQMDEGGGWVVDTCDSNDKYEEKAELSLHVEAGSNSTAGDAENSTIIMNSTFLDGTMMIGGDPTRIISSKGRENGSVISAMTDLNSLDGPNLPSLLGEEETASQKSFVDLAESDCIGIGTDNDNTNNADNGIPKQVILPQDDAALRFSSHNDDDGDHNINCSSPIVPSETCSSPASDIGAKMSQQEQMQTIGSDEIHKKTSLHLREFSDQSFNDATATTAPSSLPPQTTKDLSTHATNNAATEDDVVDDDKYDDNNVALDEYIRSPEVQNAIVERSPGGRYVRFMEKLGSGASKDVYRAYDTQEGIEVAWNVVNLSGVPKAERNRIVNEVRLLERLHHQNIISFHGSWVNRERQEVNFVTEILSSGTLKSFINKVQVIRWKIAKRWAFQILKGLEYLHSQDPPVIHRDLKCENIFINGTSGDLRIGDLGLSTVHRNGKVLSVLGTPEFMAPDMYEENSYDEKVDVYAFGMVLLEIFTKEIPYSECSNPAQIYRKVIAGEPPEVLSRLQSRHAREFVLLCLGYRDENGKYIRPTVSELLQHPFLEKRANDDDEVVVDLPPRHTQQQELLSEPIANGTPVVKRRVSTHSSQTLHHHNNTTTGEFPNSREALLQSESIPMPSNDVTPKQSRNNNAMTAARSPQADDEEDGDRFEEMQESEITMRKVKVLMGRGQELKEEDDEVPVTEIPTDTESQQQPTNVKGFENPASNGPDPVPQQCSSGSAQESSLPFHYLVAAAVIEHENPNIRPYADDILKLVVTLPVDGQTQNVQFDFHLIEDEPIQVAKEMVKELGIPQGAVLEISETISGLARLARMKQDKHAAKMQSLSNNPVPAPIVHAAITTQVQHQTYQQGMQPDTVQYAQGMQPDTIQYTQDPQSIPYTTPSVQQPNPQQMTIVSHNIQETHQYHVIQQIQQTQQNTISVNAPVHSEQSLYCINQVQLQSSVSTTQIPHPQVLDRNNNGEPQGESHAQPFISLPPQQHLLVPTNASDQNQYHPKSNLQQPHQPLTQMQSMPASNHAVPELMMPYQNNVESHRPPDPSTSIYQQVEGTHQQHDVQPQFPLHGNMNIIAQSAAEAKAAIGRPPVQVRQRSAGSDKSSDSREITIENTPGNVHPVNTHDGSTQHVAINSVVIQSTNHAFQIQANIPGLTNDVSGTQATNIMASQTVAMQSTNKTLQTQATIPGLTIGVNGPQSTQSTHIMVSQPVLMSQIPSIATQGQRRQSLEAEVITVIPNRQDPSNETVTDKGSLPVSDMHLPNNTEMTSNEDNPMANAIESEGDSDEDDDDDVDVADELRKLDEDFQKNLERATKVFVNRMDNLQRSQIEREAQHLKTLEKHEKERAEFEKRLAQEAEQQQRRIEQLQREWDKKRETVAVQKKKQKDTSSFSISDPRSETTQGHFRTISTTSSNFSLSPAMSVHKQQEPNGENGQIDR